ncbi:MAG TPA: HlyD family efflux transporter periplasmic adaptor subunit, partial [Candidatus Tumulicola sp.]
MNRRTWIALGVLALVLVLAVATFAWRSSQRSAADDTSVAPLPAVATVVARSGSVPQTIEVSGNATSQAGAGAKLSFGVSGTIESIDVAIGDRIARGSVVARLDARAYALAAGQSQAQANAQGAAAAAARVDRLSFRLRADQAELERQRTLYAAGVVARKDVQAAQATVAADRADARVAHDESAQTSAQAASASLQAQSSQLDLDRTALRAPFDGTVAQVNAYAGETVDANAAVVTVVPDGGGIATLNVPYSTAARLRIGDALALRSGTTRWSARVAAIGPSAQSDSGLIAVRVSNVPSGVVSGAPVEGSATVGVV